MDIVVLILVCTLQMYPTVSISTHHVRAVSPRDYYRNGPLPPEKTNWEIGLREASYQALVREQVPDHHLKEGLYDASIEGLQDTATPFGDIAVIARGQLYRTNQGYQFVQDPYQNDCDDCHTPHRCDRRQCEPIDQNLDNLVALWTVKRIRHRDPKFGHRYELQYTISPMSPAASPGFITRNGRFDYGIPGHVFIVKLKENGGQIQRNNLRFDKEHKSSNKEFKILPWGHDHNNQPNIYNNNQDVYNKAQTENYYHHTPNSILLNTGEYYVPQKEKTTTDHVFNPGFLIGISPNGYKHIIHDIPGLVGDRPYLEDKHYSRPQEQIPNEPIKHLHHHYYIPEVSDIDLDKKEVHPGKDQRYYTSYKPTITTTDNVHKYILTTNNIPETSPKQIYTQETTRAQVVPPLTTLTNFKTTYKYPESTVPITINPTIFENVKYHSTEPNYVDNINYPKTTVLKVFTIPATHPTNPTSFSPSPFYIQYSEPDPIYNNNQPPTVPTYITQTINPTVQPTAPTFVTIQPKTPTFYYEDYDNTQATTATPVTTPRSQKFPDSINAQLPPPEKGIDTTVPYVPSTAVTILSTGITEASILDKSDEKDTESTERKATTIQEKILSTTNNIYSTTSNPIYVEDITTILPESTFSINTSPFENVTTTTVDITTELTTMSRKNYKEDNDELFGSVNNKKKISKPKIIYQEEFDIFGPSKSTEKTSETTTVPTKKKPDAFDEIFSDFQSSTENTNRFLTPHTQLSINRTDALRNARISKYLKFKRNKNNKFGTNRIGATTTEKQNKTETPESVEGKSDDVETKTSQSYITSISYKVNKNNRNKIEHIPQLSTVQEHTEKHQKTKVESTTTDRSQTFEDVAQTLVNHARIFSYLNSKSTKPTRRSYKYKER